MMALRSYFYTVLLLVLVVGGVGGHRGKVRRQDIAYKDAYTNKEEDEMYPTSHVEPEAVTHDDMTMNLVDSLTAKTNGAADNKNNGDENNDGDDMNMGRDYVGYGDNGDNNEKASRSIHQHQQHSVVQDETNSLEEYRRYPNEAVESEFMQSQEKKSPTIVNFRDAITEDSDIIDKELKALDEEDKLLGSVKGNTLEKAISVAAVPIKNSSKVAVQLGGKNITSSDDSEPDMMDSITKELLNMKVGSNGIMSNTKSKKTSSREAILPKKKHLTFHENVVPVALMNNNSNLINASVDFADTVNLINKISPVKRVTSQNNDVTTSKADLSSFYSAPSSQHPSKVKGNKKVQNFNKMQNELLNEMFKIRTPTMNKKSLRSPTKSRKIFMSDKDLDGLQSMRRKKRKRKKKKKKREFIWRLQKRRFIPRYHKRGFISKDEGFAGAISYTDEDGHELTYTLGKDRLTYDDARRRCHHYGRGDLATIDNEREQDFITNNVIVQPDEYWIGFDDRVTEGTFEWVDSSQSPYTHWGNMEPDDGTNKRRGSPSYHNEDCALLKDTMEWSDVNCNEKHLFICKNINRGNLVWRPIFTNAMIKTNENIPTESSLVNSTSNDCNGDVGTEVCRHVIAMNAEGSGTGDVTPGGNGGVSTEHIVNEQQVAEEETLSTGVAMIKERPDRYNTLSIIDDHTSNITKENNAEEEQHENSTITTIREDLSPTAVTASQDLITNATVFPANDVSREPDDRETIMSYHKQQKLSPSSSPPSSSPPSSSPIVSPIQKESVKNMFTPDTSIVDNMCHQTCDNSPIQGCVKSCIDAVKSMSAVEFFNALHNMKTTSPHATDVETKPTVDENVLRKEVVDEIKGNLIPFYKNILTQAGYDNAGAEFNTMINQIAPTSKSSPVVAVEELPLPSKSWDMFRQKMLEAYNKTVNSPIRTTENISAPTHNIQEEVNSNSSRRFISVSEPLRKSYKEVNDDDDEEKKDWKEHKTGGSVKDQHEGEFKNKFVDEEEENVLREHLKAAGKQSLEDGQLNKLNENADDNDRKKHHEREEKKYLEQNGDNDDDNNYQQTRQSKIDLIDSSLKEEVRNDDEGRGDDTTTKQVQNAKTRYFNDNQEIIMKDNSINDDGDEDNTLHNQESSSPNQHHSIYLAKNENLLQSEHTPQSDDHSTSVKLEDHAPPLNVFDNHQASLKLAGFHELAVENKENQHQTYEKLPGRGLKDDNSKLTNEAEFQYLNNNSYKNTKSFEGYLDKNAKLIKERFNDKNIEPFGGRFQDSQYVKTTPGMTNFNSQDPTWYSSALFEVKSQQESPRDPLKEPTRKSFGEPLISPNSKMQYFHSTANSRDLNAIEGELRDIAEQVNELVDKPFTAKPTVADTQTTYDRHMHSYTQRNKLNDR